MHTTLYISSAGCGKTTTLINKVQEELDSGTSINKIAFLSYTKSAIKEAIAKALKKFPQYKLNDFIYFRTLHSLAFKMLNMSRNRMLDGKMISKFEDHMGSVGIDLSVEFDEVSALSRKNAPLYIYQIAKHRMCDIEDVYNRNYYDVSLADVNYAIKNYQAFKRSFNVLDYHDLLLNVLNDESIEPLDVDVVFLDEAQDCSKLMYAVFNKIFSKAKRVYIAGDDFQNLYTWSGSDVNNFLNIKHDKKITLETSYRLPSNILNFSKQIVERVPISHRFEKPIKTNKSVGKIEKIFDIYDIKDYILSTLLKGESWLILVRNIYLYQKFHNALYEAGIPFLQFNKTSYDYNVLKSIVDYEKVRQGIEPLTDKIKNDLLNYMPTVNLSKNWFEAFTYLSIEDANYIRDIRSNNFKADKLIEYRPLIEVTTIHRSKGREADHVIVLPDQSALTNKMSEIYQDEEHRCFYVAVTRSRQSLFIMEPTSQLYYDLNF